ncbi:MAG: right-handed parallel beta-helix repeat-containing protein, partial [Rhodobacteraceae bacterium]|nr:right-handed parallel beta-helix repeat-containing protein [Paracoccaceae bacterium]
GLVETGASTTLTAYGEVVEVSAIIGTGNRGGVDMVWGNGAIYGHFGLDLTGATGGVVRVDDIVIEDITSAFLRDMMDWVDVRDYGAVGDGVTDDSAAFEAADAAAAGRRVLVSSGTYFLGQNVTFESPARFQGTVTMPDDKRLSLQKNFDLPSYVDAFGDEVLAFRKAFQALLGNTDHESLDLGGRRIELDAPIEMQSAVPDQTTYSIRRVIRNGQFNVIDGPAWAPDTASSQADYSPANPFTLSNVANIAQVPVGARLTGAGVGREVYVTAVNVGAGTLTLSQALHGPAATQSYSFERFKYVLDFSGFARLDRMTLTDIDFFCSGFASGVMLAPQGSVFKMNDCYVTKPRDRGVTSIGLGCQDLQIDRCQFISNEQALLAIDRTSIAFNVNANDSKVRNSRFVRFGHTAVMHGTGHLIVGNHWFQGDSGTDTPRQAGFVFTQENLKSVITGNYVDNSFIEWTNEHDAAPNLGAEYSFGGLTLTGNIFTVNDAASWFSWLVVKPYGSGHFLQGLSVTGNTFLSINGTTDRIERVDDSIAGLDFGRSRNIVFEGNTFNGIAQPAINPVTLEFNQVTDSAAWVLDVGGYLPFGGWARTVSAVVAEADLADGTGAPVHGAPIVMPNYGAAKTQVRLDWPVACHGTVQVTARMDKPV